MFKVYRKAQFGTRRMHLTHRLSFSERTDREAVAIQSTPRI
jgi:hypothetical protein